MTTRWDNVARGIRAFVENPVTNLTKGIALLMIGIADASHTFQEGVDRGHFRVGHGLILIGVFSILDALPHLIGSLEASERFLERSKKVDRGEQADGPSISPPRS